MAKVTELWTEVEKSLEQKTGPGIKFAVIEAHKILQAVLDSKKYPGKTLEKQLFWAGYSLKEKNGIAEALKKHEEILQKFDFQFSDFEAEETVRAYHKVITEITAAPDFSIQDRLKMIVEVYFSPKSLLFWRNFGILFGFFLLIKILSKTVPGQSIATFFVDLADFVISWTFLAIIIIIVGLFFALGAYLENRSKVKIKE